MLKLMLEFWSPRQNRTEQNISMMDTRLYTEITSGILYYRLYYTMIFSTILYFTLLWAQLHIKSQQPQMLTRACAPPENGGDGGPLKGGPASDLGFHRRREQQMASAVENTMVVCVCFCGCPHNKADFLGSIFGPLIFGNFPTAPPMSSWCLGCFRAKGPVEIWSFVSHLVLRQMGAPRSVPTIL